MAEYSVSCNDITDMSVSDNDLTELDDTLSDMAVNEEFISVSGNDADIQASGNENYMQPLEVIIEYPETVSLWDSNINDYNVTDGLLLCILVVLMVDVFLHNKRR